jgi:hypothetical protein
MKLETANQPAYRRRETSAAMGDRDEPTRGGQRNPSLLRTVAAMPVTVGKIEELARHFHEEVALRFRRLIGFSSPRDTFAAWQRFNPQNSHDRHRATCGRGLSSTARIYVAGQSRSARQCSQSCQATLLRKSVSMSIWKRTASLILVKTNEITKLGTKDKAGRIRPTWRSCRTCCSPKSDEHAEKTAVRSRQRGR